MERYELEIILFDTTGQSDIITVDGLVHSLLFVEALWKNPQVNYAGTEAIILDLESDIEFIMRPWEHPTRSEEQISAAFTITVLSDNIENLDRIREKLIYHFRKKLRFNHIRLLRDDVSTELSNLAYPKINKVENALREFIVKFFLRRKGINWWEKTVSEDLHEKIKFRKQFNNSFSNLLDQDVNLIDFNELGELIFRKNNETFTENKLRKSINQVQTLEDLQQLRIDIQGNYNKYFTKPFKEANFEVKWKALLDIRNKVAHNSFLTLSDLDKVEELSDALLSIISEADTFLPNTADVIQDKADESSHEDTSINDDADVKTSRLKKFGLKVVGHLDLDKLKESEEPTENLTSHKVISEEEMLKEIEVVEQKMENSELRYIGLKAFITKVLAQKGYAISPAYALINHLDEVNIIDIYDYTDEFTQYPVKAIRTISESDN